MSRAGRASGQARAAVAPEEAPAPVEIPAEAEQQFRAQRLYSLCKADLVRHHPPLWPPEVVGMGIAEQWLQNLHRRMQEAAAEQWQARAAEAGLIPS